jgi:hypothetical protein
MGGHETRDAFAKGAARGGDHITFGAASVGDDRF